MTAHKSSVTHVQERRKRIAKHNAQLPSSVLVDSLLIARMAQTSSVTHVQERRKKTAKHNAQLTPSRNLPSVTKSKTPSVPLLAKKELSGARMVQNVHAMRVQKAAHTTVLSAMNQRSQNVTVVSFINVPMERIQFSAMDVHSLTRTAKPNVQPSQKKKNVPVVSFISVPMERILCSATDAHRLTRTVKLNAQLIPNPNPQ